MTIDLRCGDWRHVLADVECDTLISDPPYSERTHAGHNDGIASANSRQRRGYKNSTRREITYAHWTPNDAEIFVRHWSPRTRGWFVVMTDHILAPAFERELEAQGRYLFAPLQFMHIGSRVRITGDGPSLWSVSIVVARPMTRDFMKWGALPGGYVLPPNNLDRERSGVVGGKPLWIMRALVRDYSRPGNLVCDPCAGAATTLLAAAIEGRHAVGAELDPDTFALASKRIARGYTPTLFGAGELERCRMRQANLFDSAAVSGNDDGSE